MIIKKILLISFIITSFSFHLKPNNDFYAKALEKIIESNEYGKLLKKKGKYYVSDEVIIYSKLGKFFKTELEKHNPLTEDEIAINSRKTNSINKNLLKLNLKKCKGRIQIFFSEIKQGIFFAEIFESKKSFKYKDRPSFGISYIYMFKEHNNNVELINIEEIIYN